MTNKRKGSKSNDLIEPAIMAQLNKGEIESANLVEWLAIDQRTLLSHTLGNLNRMAYYAPVLDRLNNIEKPTVNRINECIGLGLFELAEENNDSSLFSELRKHPSDLVRCWATYSIGSNEHTSLNEKLDQIQFFAADPHFGVREIAWMAVRSAITNQLDESIAILLKWTTHTDENIRRFASESIRPRGVWCTHISALKEQPDLALAILESLKSDPSRYVQNSVGNWLNDASKTAPAFVEMLCKRWAKENPTKETAYIIKKGMRSIQ